VSDEILTPADALEAAEIVRSRQSKAAIDIAGAGTRAGFGRPREGVARLSTATLDKLVFHEPAEMILRAEAGAPLSAIEASLVRHNQMLPFEPVDPRPLFGTTGEPTIGGLVATALSGPRRISAGAVRDSLIGLRFINGEGEILNTGGRVMKNVTGLDLVKIQCGGHGTLGLILEATFKLLPRPETEATIVLRRLDDAQASTAMSRALGSPFGVSGAALLHAGMGRDFSRCVLRVEGFAESVAYRIERLLGLLAGFDPRHVLEVTDSRRLWRSIRDLEFVAEPRERAVWRVSVKPSDGAALLQKIGGVALASQLDWGGGLVWIASEPTEAAAAAIRSATRALAGHATLMRADDALRERSDVFEPPAPLVLQQAARLKASLDPRAVFNHGRMYAGV
jgi:glycolate oxidase FAD binding subunit